MNFRVILSSFCAVLSLTLCKKSNDFCVFSDFYSYYCSCTCVPSHYSDKMYSERPCWNYLLDSATFRVDDDTDGIQLVAARSDRTEFDELRDYILGRDDGGGVIRMAPHIY